MIIQIFFVKYVMPYSMDILSSFHWYFGGSSSGGDNGRFGGNVDNNGVMTTTGVQFFCFHWVAEGAVWGGGKGDGGEDFSELIILLPFLLILLLWL